MRVAAFELEIQDAGEITIELRSYGFDAYLILRSDDGKILATDDNGLGLSMHARLQAHVDPGSVDGYVIEACAPPGEDGGFELRILRGSPPASDLPISREIRYAKKCLQALEAEKGRDHVALTMPLNTLGHLYWRTRRFDEALEMMQRQLQIARATFGEEDDRVGFAHMQVASQLLGLRRPEEARSHSLRALEIGRASLGPDHPQVVDALRQLAVTENRLGRFEEAREYAAEALEIQKRTLGPQHEKTAQCMHSLGWLDYELGNYSAACDQFGQALEIRTNVLGAEHPTTLDSAEAFASALTRTGDSTEAVAVFEQVLAIRERTCGPEHEQTAGTQQAFGVLLGEIGEFARARDMHEHALATLERSNPNGPGIANILNSLALVLEELGDLPTAWSIHERALALYEKNYGPNHPYVAYSLESMGEILRETGQLVEARPLLERALRLREAAYGDHHIGTTSSRMSLASVLVDLEEYEAARPLLEHALASREKHLGPNHPMTAGSLSSLAGLHYKSGNLDEAVRCTRRAIEILEATRGPTHTATLNCRRNLVRELLAAGRTVEAAASSRRAIEATLDHRDESAWALSEAERYLLAEEHRSTLLLHLSLPASDPETTAGTYESMTEWKGWVFRDLARSRSLLHTELDEVGQTRLERLRTLQSRIADQVLATSAGSTHESGSDLDRMRRERAELERELARAAGPAVGPRMPKVAELASLLPKDSAFVDFFLHGTFVPGDASAEGGPDPGKWTEPRVTAWVLTPGSRAPVRLDLGDVSRLEEQGVDWIDEMTAYRGRGVAGVEPSALREPRRSSRSRRIRQALWDPIREHLGGAHRVFLSPDGFLGRLPFGALEEESGKYLIETYTISHVESSASLAGLLTSDPRPQAVPSVLCLGGVDYARRRDEPAAASTDGPSPPGPPVEGARRHLGHSTTWDALPGTGKEADRISRLHRERFGERASRLDLRGPDATEERMKRELPSHSVVHLATHGFFEGIGVIDHPLLDSDPASRATAADRGILSMPTLRSGLVLAGANQGPAEGRDNGILTAEEISFLDLAGVDLVVLSACETALGAHEPGEGLLGLRRSLRQAGARTVVSSLWRVDDQTTAELMQRFYERMWTRGETSAAALRNAQLDMLNENREANDGRGLASTWAAFVLDGSWK